VLQPLGYVPAVQAALRMPESSLEETTGFGEGGGSSAAHLPLMQPPLKRGQLATLAAVAPQWP